MPKPSAVMKLRGTFFSLLAIFASGASPMLQRKGFDDLRTMTGITAACRKYLQPLIGGEAYPPYANGLPAYVTLKGASVPKRLRVPFVV